MGEYAEMILDGTMCSGCGEFLHDGNDGPGYPGLCSLCAREATNLEKRERPTSDKKTMQCPDCTRRFATHESYLQHYRDRHEKKTGK